MKKVPVLDRSHEGQTIYVSLRARIKRSSSVGHLAAAMPNSIGRERPVPSPRPAGVFSGQLIITFVQTVKTTKVSMVVPLEYLEMAYLIHVVVCPGSLEMQSHVKHERVKCIDERDKHATTARGRQPYTYDSN